MHKRLEILEIINKTIHKFVGAAIGLMVVILFWIVILSVVVVAVVMAIGAQPQQAIPLLNTVLAIVSSALSAVLGFFLGRRTQDK
jgi:uncharacterized membrane protein (Fun14 family)